MFFETKRFRSRGLALAATTVTLLALTGCSGASSSGSSGGDKTLTLGSQLTPVSFAADGANWGSESIYEQAAYDTLLHADAKTGDPLPWLATTWTYSADKKTITFKLRDDVKFSDGTPFDADAAAQNILRYKKGTGSQASTLDNLADAKAVDSTTLELSLSQPDPAMLSYLSQAPGQMESPKAFDGKTAKTVPVGTGPYVMDTAATVVGSKYVFTKNDDYWNKKEAQHFDKVEIQVLSDPQAQVNAVKGKQVDGANLTDQTTFKTVASSGYTLATQEIDWQGLVIADKGGTLTPALKDVRVRQAINYAIDAKAILKAGVAGQGTPTRQMFPPYSPGFDTSLDSAYPFDPAKAKALLAEAGYPSFTLNLPQVPGYGQVQNDLIKQYLGDVGIQVTFTTVPQANFITDLLAAKYSAFFIGFQQDPVAFQEANFILTPNATFNMFKYEDPTVVGLVAKIQTGTEEESDAATKELNKYAVDNAWNNVWYRVKSAFATSPDITVQTQAGNVLPYLYNIKPKQ